MAGSFCSSVVAKMNTTYSGGSSSVFSSALNALAESMCTSSMMYTRFLSALGGYTTSSRMSRILSTPLLEAASISSTSVALPASIERQASQARHGEPFCGFSQLTALARIFAQVVFPVPREPQNK